MERVLIVEDDPILQKCIQFCLKQEGYEVEVSCSQEEAEMKLRGNRYDLIITDYQLRGEKTGLELLAFLNNRSHKTPVIMISGSKKRELPDQVLQYGAFAFLHKPFDLEIFTRTAKDALISRQGGRTSA